MQSQKWSRNAVKKNEGIKNQIPSALKIKTAETSYYNETCNTVNRKNDIYESSNSLVLSEKAKISHSRDTSAKVISFSCQNHENEITNNQVKMETTNESMSNVAVKGTEKMNTTNHGIFVNKREELNAFHVLMPRNKSPKQLMQDEQALTVENRQESSSKFEQSDDKLTLPSERKRCMKRKLSEDVQGQGKTKKQLGSHLKTFEHTTVKDYVKTYPNTINQKILTHGLHNYFNKIAPLDKEKTEDLEPPTIIVKSGIHRTEMITSLKVLDSKINDNNIKSKVRQVLNTIGDAAILQSKTSNLLPTQTAASERKEEQPRYQKKKSRWSLRINLHALDPECDTMGEDKLNEEKKQSKISTKSKRKEKHKNGNSQKQKKSVEINKDVNVDIDDISYNTSASSLVLSKEICDLENHVCSKDLNIDNEIIVVNKEKRSNNGKLAPLFIKQSKPDHKILKARQCSTLYSQLPEIKEKEFEFKSYILLVSALPFPSISHVTQLNNNTKFNNLMHYIKYRGKEVYVAHLDPTDLKYVNNYIDIRSKYSIPINAGAKGSIEAILQEIEKRCTDAREIWKNILTITNNSSRRLSPKKIKPKHKSTNAKKNQAGIKNNVHVDTWTQKYRPLSAKQVVGNEEAATKLRNWLRTWKLSANEDNYSSSDEFYCSDNSCNNLSKNNQVAILLGPYGCGKTACVYAIAEELNYTVLEVNASSKRSGRIIIRELEEATKSHRVKKMDSKAITQHKLNSKTNISERSLILIEDVDLIFDEDEGFASAIYQLASNTKCPIAMTCRYSCSLLNRMAPQQLQIFFRAISGTRAMALIELIALAETGSSISHLCLEKLIACGDLRKALLNLQYLLQSEIPQTMEWSSLFQETWMDVCKYFYNPIIKMNTGLILKKDENIHVLKTAISGEIPRTAPPSDLDIVSLANDLDIMALVSSLIEINDPVFHESQVKFESSLSLEENMDLYSNKNVQSNEISQWMRSQIIHKNIKDSDGMDDRNGITIFNQLLAQKESNKTVKLALSQVSTYTLDSRILSTDYLPVVRTICRAEDVKVDNNMKRGNRFFHYLQNLRLPSTSIKPNILKAASKIMQEST
ncbi:hypothetical protein PV327_008101 [Microctonus hyperodae]|uniref:AAA+ ATPase domain-containing protein n=1 Tax=Microctonus hyperodae TaxID=165561 RepID=A0AA39KGT3_MICHY|nr:hypothetical protein PV327_008101 [Microctonus hyperodae]